MRDRLHELEIARNPLTLQRARLTVVLIEPAVPPPPAVLANLRAEVARLDGALIRMAREEAILRAMDTEGR